MIGILCALRCEAEPLIKSLKLKAFPEKTVYPLYYSDHIFLVVSGIGKTLAASAAAYLCSFIHGYDFALVNVGIGGHKSYTIGEAFLADQVIDAGTDINFYPSFPWKRFIPTSSVITVEKVQEKFEKDSIYEMEASGFCTSAFQFTSAELIHCFKVVSDHENTDRNELKVNKGKISELIYGQWDALERLLTRLTHVQKTLSDVEIEPINPFVKKWHFTRSQLHLLKYHLQSWRAWNSHLSIWDEKLDSCKNAKEVLSYLGQKCFR